MKKLELIKFNDNNDKKVINVSRCDTFLSVKYKLHKLIDVSVKLLVIYSDRNALYQERNNDFIPNNTKISYYNILEESPDDVFLLIKRNYFDIPKFVQLSKHQSIKYLKEILNCSNSDLKIFLFDSDGKLLDENKSIEESGLIDNSKLSVWQGEDLKVELTICNPLIKITEICQSQIVGISNCLITDSIKTVKNHVSKFINSEKEMNLTLYTELSVLRDGKFLVDYPIRNSNNIIYYVDLIKGEKCYEVDEIESKLKGFKIHKGDISGTTMISGTFKNFVINKYKTENADLIKRKSLKYEIITHLKLTACKKSLFVSLISLFEEKSYFNIVVEYMEEGSLKDLYDSKKLSIDEILNYSYQILEALSFMHTNYIIHRTVKCSSVLLCGDQKRIKLTNFHLSKFLFNNTFEEMTEGVNASEHGTDSDIYWVAPEVLSKELYGLKADIWSFGATVIEMLTRKKPFDGFNPVRASSEIIKNKTIPYDLDLYPTINSFVKRCIAGEQSDRPVASELMNDSIFNNISSNQADAVLDVHREPLLKQNEVALSTFQENVN